MTKLKDSNFDKTKKNQIVTKLKTKQIVMVVIVTVVVRTTQQLETSTSVWCVQGSFSQSCDVLALGKYSINTKVVEFAFWFDVTKTFSWLDPLDNYR